MKIIDLQEARTTQRRPALEMGLIRFGDISASCVLRNVSEGGAALDIGSQVGIPDQFTLIVLPQKKIYSCNVVWRKERRIGIHRFTGGWRWRSHDALWFALIGLAPQKVVATWLKEHVRLFRRQYFLSSERIRRDAADGFEDLLGCLGPGEGAWVFVAGVEPAADVGVELVDGAVGPAT